MAELDLQKMMAEATQQRSSIATTLLAIQKSLGKMQSAVAKMEPVLDSLEPAYNELHARRPEVDKLQTDTMEIQVQLTKIAHGTVPTVVVAPAPAISSTGGLYPKTDGDDPVASCKIPRSAPPFFSMSSDASTTLPSWLFPISELDTMASSRCSIECLVHDDDLVQPMHT